MTPAYIMLGGSKMAQFLMAHSISVPLLYAYNGIKQLTINALNL